MKTALITGAGSGLGLELVKVFVRNHWRVLAVVHDLHGAPSDLQNENIQILSADLSTQDSIDKIRDALKDEVIDVLVNCAGLYDSAHNSVDDDAVMSTVPDVTTVFQVNAFAPKILADSLVGNLEKGTEKLVVTISSGMGTYSEMDEYHAAHWPYSASKAAVNYAMIAFAKMHPNIKSVLISPGWMKTKIGGKDAPLEPGFSAEKIFHLISNHRQKLPNAKLVDYEGRGMQL